MRNRRYHLVKRSADVAAASVGLVLVAPAMGVISVVIWRRMGRPILFRQQRAGQGARPFSLLKYRTMSAALGGVTTSADDERRITPLGEHLRSWSIDELPQLLNVLRGDMSFVGPRPLPLEYVARYSSAQIQRLDVKPGITGWAQVNGRNNVDWEARLSMDAWYVSNESFTLDLKILVKTARTVLTRRGISAAEHGTMPEFLGTQLGDGGDD